MANPDLPGPVPCVADAAFWSACRERKLVFRHCGACDAWHHPPLPLCPRCQGGQLEWRPAEGAAQLFTWTRAHLAMHPAVDRAVPYYIGVVEFPDCGHVRLLARLEHLGKDSPAIGSECVLDWICAGDGQLMPAFHTVS